MVALCGCRADQPIREVVDRGVVGKGHAERCQSFEDFLDIRAALGRAWDLMIAHPPCTHLASSGARWWAEKRAEQADAIAFVRALLDAPVDRIALENPIGILSTAIRRPDQIIQPHQFGHGETKTTCLWLKNLPPLRPTNIVEGREQRIHHMPPSPERSKERSRTYLGIAEAMATQWSRPYTTGFGLYPTSKLRRGL